MQQFSHDCAYSICTFSIRVLKDSSKNKKTDQNTWSCLDHSDTCYGVFVSCSYLRHCLWKDPITKSSTHKSPSPLLSPCLMAGSLYMQAAPGAWLRFLLLCTSVAGKGRNLDISLGWLLVSHQEDWNSEFLDLWTLWRLDANCLPEERVPPCQFGWSTSAGPLTRKFHAQWQSDE